jgi:hypothetical protein
MMHGLGAYTPPTFLYSPQGAADAITAAPAVYQAEVAKKVWWNGWWMGFGLMGLAWAGTAAVYLSRR